MDIWTCSRVENDQNKKEMGQRIIKGPLLNILFL